MSTAFVKWTENLSVKNDLIDQQHQKLIDILNRFYTAFIEKKHTDILAEIIKELNDYTIYHFKTEEKMLMGYNYGDLKNHIAEHQKFLDTIKSFKEDLEKSPGSLTYKVMTFLREWICTHIMVADQKYVSLYA